MSNFQSSNLWYDIYKMAICSFFHQSLRIGSHGRKTPRRRKTAINPNFSSNTGTFLLIVSTNFTLMVTICVRCKSATFFFIRLH